MVGAEPPFAAEVHMIRRLSPLVVAALACVVLGSAAATTTVIRPAATTAAQKSPSTRAAATRAKAAKQRVAARARQRAQRRARLNARSRTLAGQRDTVAPTTPGPLVVTRATQLSIALSWPASRDAFGVAGYDVLVSGRGRATVKTTAVTLRKLSCGSAYDVGVVAFDRTGNRSARAAATVSTAACPDTSPPTVPADVYQVNATSDSAYLEWSSATDDVGVVAYDVYDGGVRVGESSGTSFVLRGLACDSSRWVEVDAVDAAGNHSARKGANASSSACPDTTPPTAPSSIAVSAATTSAISVSWSASSDANGVSSYAVYLNGSKTATSSGTSATLAGLACGTSYTIGVEAVDAAGNVSGRTGVSAATASCAPPPPSDTAAPTVPGGLRVASSSPTSVSLAWSASTDNVGVSSYGVYRNGSSVVSVSATTATVGGLACGTSYRLEVDAVDAAGNRSTRSGIDTATAGCTDTVSPSAPGTVQASARGVSTLAVTWGAASDNIGVTGYGVYLNGTSVGTTSASQRAWNFSALACDTMYSVAVDAVDAAGNRSAKAASLIATTPCPDTTPPTTPAGLATAAVTPTGATLSWQASTDGVGVAGYRVYRNGTAVGTTTGTSYAVTGLTCGVAAQLGVEAYDGAANVSGRATVGVTAGACSGSTASIFLSPTGADANACTQAAPCKTLQRGFNAASAGGVVQLAGGTYAGGSLGGDKGSASDVVFQPEPGASVVVSSRLTLASLHHVTLRGLSFQTSDTVRDLMLEACNDDVTLDSVTGRKFMIIEGNSNITIANSSWGGYGTPGDTVDNVIGTAGATGPVRQCGGATAGPASNILIDRTRFHDVFWGVQTSKWSGAHPDCFEINGYVNGVTVRNSEFDHCVDSFFGLYTDQGDLLNVTFENNRLHDGGTESWYAIQNVCSGSNGYRGGNIVFRGNMFDTNASAFDPYPALRAECAPKAGYAPVLVQGNTFAQGPPSSSCSTSRGSPYNTSWDANRFTYGSACGTTG